MFEFREKSILEVFLESDNLQGFFSNMELIRAIADYDQQMLTELEAARDDAELKHVDADAKREAADAVVVAKQAEIDELRGQIQRNTDELAAAQAVLAARQAEEDEMLAESARIGALIHELQEQKEQEEAEEEAARRAAEEARRAAEEVRERNVRHDDLAVPSSRWLHFSFPAGRPYRLPGQTRPHMVVDIGADYGAPVVATAEGRSWWCTIPGKDRIPVDTDTATMS
jgi:murein DD-endopeptidase MepM/ murein hydrolase activator NlpD